MLERNGREPNVPVRAMLWIAAVAAGLAVAACGFPGFGAVHGTTPGASNTPGRLTIAVASDPETLDPAQVATPAAAQVVRLAVQPLVTIDKQGRLAPLLATGWDVSPDGSTYTFTLRRGVRFSDGEPLDAAAVKVSLDRLLNPRTVRAQPGTLKVIRAVRAVDAAHVAVTLEKPDPQLPQALAGVQAGIVAPNSISASRLTPPQLLRLVGTGPYVLKGRVIGRYLTLARNPTYWGPRPGFAEQLFEIVPDTAARTTLVRDGKADVAAVPSLLTTARVRGVTELPDGQLVTAEAAPI